MEKKITLKGFHQSNFYTTRLPREYCSFTRKVEPVTSSKPATHLYVVIQAAPSSGASKLSWPHHKPFNTQKPLQQQNKMYAKRTNKRGTVSD